MSQGGSTLTQQLVKNYFLTPERTVKRKLLEAYLAVILESRTSKEDILELYLNEVYLGQRGSFGIHGVGQAASIFFGKDVKNLGVEEAALVAAIIRSPNAIAPFRHPEDARVRRNVVLDQMVEAGFLEPRTPRRRRAASGARLGHRGSGRGTLFRRRAAWTVWRSSYDLEAIQSRELSGRTRRWIVTFKTGAAGRRRGARGDSRQARRRQQGATPGRARRHGPPNGRRARLVGARSYGTSQFNRALDAHRQPGSAFKPFVYLAAFEADQSLGPTSTVVDEPTTFRQGKRTWTPQNYTRRFEGRVTFRRALASSLNVATARVGETRRVRPGRRSLGGDGHDEPARALPVPRARLVRGHAARAHLRLCRSRERGRARRASLFHRHRGREREAHSTPSPYGATASPRPKRPTLVTDMLHERPRLSGPLAKRGPEASPRRRPARRVRRTTPGTPGSSAIPPTFSPSSGSATTTTALSVFPARRRRFPSGRAS